MLKTAFSTLKRLELFRPWRFSVILQGELGQALRGKEILVRATSLPAKSASDINLEIGATTLRYPGPIQYDGQWVVTFLDTDKLEIRKAIDSVMGNIPFLGDPKFQQSGTITVLYGCKNEKVYLRNAYISDLGDIKLDYGNDALSFYDVKINYHTWDFGESGGSEFENKLNNFESNIVRNSTISTSRLNSFEASFNNSPF